MSIRTRTLAIFLIIGIGFGVLLIYLRDHGFDLIYYYPNMGNIFLFLLFIFLIPFIHEPGHVLAGLVIRWSAGRVVFGSGKELVRFRIFGIVVVVKAFPGSGFTYLGSKRSRFSKPGLLLFFSGGMLLQLLVSVVVVFAFDVEPYDFFGSEELSIAGAFVAANFISIAGTLIPRRIRMGLNSFPNDGMRIFNIHSMKEKDLDDFLASGLMLDAMDLVSSKKYAEALVKYEECTSSYPDVNGGWINMGLTLIKLSRFGEAEKIYLSLLDRPHDRAYDGLIYNNMAWIYLLMGDGQSLEAANSAIGKAYAANPLAKNMGTGGCILVAMRKYDEGIRALERIVSSKPIFARDENFCIDYLFLAFAYHDTGRKTKTDSIVKRIRKCIPRLDADNLLLFRRLCSQSDAFARYFDN
jgi:hypothetical protein